MITINLTNGGRAIIDFEDYERVCNHNWSLATNKGYVQNNTYRHKYRTLHRFVLNYDGNLDVDHINHDKLDNRKSNLRIVSKSMNGINRKEVPVNIVKRIRKSGKVMYDAQIQVLGTKHHLGVFSSYKRAEIVATSARNNILAGKNVIYALKRKHRWSKLERISIDISEL